MTGWNTQRTVNRRALSNPGAREATARRLRTQYEAGTSIRQLAAKSGFSYGTVRTLLVEAGTALRERGRPGAPR